MTIVQVALRRCFVLSAVALAACAQPDADIIARELYGTWQTDAPEYTERGFVLTADSITLHQGGGIQVTYPVEDIRRTERNGYTDYLVTYQGIVSSLEFPLEYRAGDGEPDLRFPNQQRVIWKRVTPASAPAGS